MMELDIAKFALEYAQRSPQEILKLALDKFDDIVISFSGAEDVVLIDRDENYNRQEDQGRWQSVSQVSERT